MDVLKKLLHGDGSPPPKTQDELKKLCAHSFLCRDRLCVEDDHKHCVPREEAKRALSVTLLPPELERKVRWHGSIPDFNSRLDHLNERIKEAIKTGHPTYETVDTNTQRFQFHPTRRGLPITAHEDRDMVGTNHYRASDVAA